MSALNVRAVVIGSLVDVIGTGVASGVFFAVLGRAASTGSTDELVQLYEGSIALQVATLGLGLAMTAVGAYVAARLAKSAERMHAFAVGVVSTVTSFMIVFSAPESSPFWSQAASLILTVPAAFVGGEIRRATAGQGRRPT